MGGRRGSLSGHSYLLNALYCHADCRVQLCLTAGSRQRRSEWVRGSHSLLCAGGGLTRQKAFSPGSVGVINPTNLGNRVRWVLVVPVAGGCCHWYFFWETPFPSLLCDPHRSVIKKGKSQEKGAVAQRRCLSVPCVACRPQPEQSCEGQVKPQKIRIISFICSSVVVPLRGTPKQFEGFLVVFFPCLWPFKCFLPQFWITLSAFLALEVALPLRPSG